MNAMLHKLLYGYGYKLKFIVQKVNVAFKLKILHLTEYI